MATRFNTYFNSPQFAQAASNLSSLFAPPSAADEFNYERASGQRFQNDAIGQAWQAMTAAGATPEVQDRYGVAATLFGQGFNPTQTNRAVDIASADRRYNVDSRDATAITTQGMANAAGLAETAMTPLDEGERRPGLPGFTFGQLLSAAGLEMPDDYVDSEVGTEFGLPRPRTSDEVQALNLQNALRSNPDLATALAFGDLDTTNVVGPDGSPQIAFSGLAARSGAEPFVQTGSQASVSTGTYVDTQTGERVTASIDPATGELFTIQNGERQRLDPRRFVQEAGANLNRVDVPAGSRTQQARASLAINQADAAIADTYAAVSRNPNAIGWVGGAKRFGQSAVATFRELATDPSLGTVSSAEQAAQAIESAFGGGTFEPELRQIAGEISRLAYIIAARDKQGGEVAVQDVARISERLQSGAMGSSIDLLTVLEDEWRNNRRLESGLPLLSGGEAEPLPAYDRDAVRREITGFYGGEGSGPAPATASRPAVGTVEDGFRFLGGDPANRNNWEAVQ